MNSSTVTALPANELFKALSEPTRLRVLHLLGHGPLCVCHIHDILELPQAKVSQQLSYLRKHNLVTTQRYHNWTLYSLPARTAPLFTKTLEALSTTDFKTDSTYKRDLQRLEATDTSAACEAAAACC